jgi:hypothetical protein
VREEPDFSSELRGRLPKGTQIFIKKRNESGWIELEEGGWVNELFVTSIRLPEAEREAAVALETSSSELLSHVDISLVTGFAKSNETPNNSDFLNHSDGPNADLESSL